MVAFRQDKMTRDERWVALLNRQPVDRVPIIGMSRGFAALNTGYTIKDIYSDPQKTYYCHKWTDEMYGWQDRTQCSRPSRVLGREVRLPEGIYDGAPIITRHTVTTEEEAWALKLPSVEEATAGAMECAKMRAESGAPSISVSGASTSGAGFCGIETFCRWMMKKPDLAHHLMRLATDRAVEIIKYFVDTFGPERLVPYGGTPNESNQLISPKLVEEFHLPYKKEFYEKVIAMGVKHSMVHLCGEQNLNLPLWSQVRYGDPAIITFGHEVDLETASKYFPNDIIMGNVEPVLFVTARPEEVYESARICIEKGKKHRAGFVLAPGCELPPRATPYNVWMMTKAVNDFGWYE